MTPEQRKFYDEVIHPKIIEMALNDSLPLDMNGLYSYYFDEAAERFNRANQVDKLDKVVMELTLRTLKEQMEDGNHDGRYDLFLAVIDNGLGITNAGKMFSIDGYFKDDKENPFESYLVYEFDDCPEHLDDDSIFFYGLSERGIKEAIELGEDTVHDFVITNYVAL